MDSQKLIHQIIRTQAKYIKQTFFLSFAWIR